MSDYLKMKYTIGVASGSSALYMALKSLDIKKGDEVITTPFSWIITSNAIVECGATPIFVDIRDDYNINEDLIQKKITKELKQLFQCTGVVTYAIWKKIKKIAKKINFILLKMQPKLLVLLIMVKNLVLFLM